jgi:hypothetical protein
MVPTNQSPPFPRFGRLANLPAETGCRASRIWIAVGSHSARSGTLYGRGGANGAYMPAGEIDALDAN